MPQPIPSGISRGYEKFIDTDELEYHYQLFLTGNERSAKIIFEKLHISVFKYCFYTMQDKSEADNIVCDAISRLWENRDEITDFSYAKNYVRKTVKWACRNSKAARLKVLLVDFMNDSDLAFYNPDDEAEQRRMAAIEAENIRLIEKAIPYLPPGRKIVMELYNRGRTPKAIAKEIGKTYQFVSQEIEHGIRDLKIILPRLKKAVASSQRNSPLLKLNYRMHVSSLQADVLDRYVKGMELKVIAQELYMTVWKVTWQLDGAIRKLKRVAKERGKRKFRP